MTKEAKIQLKYMWRTAIDMQERGQYVESRSLIKAYWVRYRELVNLYGGVK